VGRVLASLVGLLGEFDLAEEGAQEAFAVYSTRGERLRRLGRTDEAREAFERALALARSALPRAADRRAVTARPRPAGT
jgi:predicted RNA polymerase sigma factor